MCYNISVKREIIAMTDYSALQNGSDIRGVAMEGDEGRPVNLTVTAAFDIAAAFALWLGKKTGKQIHDLGIAVGRDSRITGEALAEGMMEAWLRLGVTVYDAEMATTPAMFMSTQFSGVEADGAVMITASHLPYDRNGFKFFTKEGGLGKKDIKEILAIAGDYDADEAETEGFYANYSIMARYCDHLRRLICGELGKEMSEKPLSGLKVAVDAGNGAGGFYVEEVLKPLGADCTGSQFLDPDGYFPVHVPNPESEEALGFISRAVKRVKADLGIIFDTDVDRAAAVGSDGKPIARNGIVALAAVIAKDSCGDVPATIVTDSITSTQLGAFLTETLGLRHLRFKRGYKNVIDKGIELNSEGELCPLAIETSGHAAMKENYFLDDGAYLATKIVIKAAKLKAEGKHVEDLLRDLAEPAEAKEFRLPVTAEDFASYADGIIETLTEDVREGKLPGMSLELPNYEGVRVNVNEDGVSGWLLLRKSLHEPLMPLNIESDCAGGVSAIASQLRDFLSAYPQLDISKLN